MGDNVNGQASDYVASLGFVSFPVDPDSVRRGLLVRKVECVHCGQVFDSEGSVMRGHRRRCAVFSFDPYTPGVCDS